MIIDEPIWVKIHWENPPFWALVIKAKQNVGYKSFSCVVLHKNGITDPFYCNNSDFRDEPDLDDF